MTDNIVKLVTDNEKEELSPNDLCQMIVKQLSEMELDSLTCIIIDKEGNVMLMNSEQSLAATALMTDVAKGLIATGLSG